MHEGAGSGVIPGFSPALTRHVEALALFDEPAGRGFRRRSGARLNVRPRKPAGLRPAGADPESLARHVVAGRIADAREHVSARLRSGASAVAVMLDDLAPAARRLGEFWLDDDFDFLAVTFAAHVLQLLLRDLGGEDAPISPQTPSALFTLSPGETHELGADVAAKIFRLAGWRVERRQVGDVARALAREPFDVVGFSASCERYVGSLGGAIAQARAASRRPLIAVVGGAVFAAKPGLAKQVGADFEARESDICALPDRLRKALRR